MDILDRYDYHLPEELVAKTPASPRESARLFVYNTKTDEVAFDIFANIGRYLPHPALLVMNNTKVVPARLWLTKQTGGKIEVLLMMNEYRQGDTEIKGIVDRKLAHGATLFFKSGATLAVTRQDEQFFFFHPSVSIPELFLLLECEGVTPIPPYIKGSPLSEAHLRSEYQSVLAKHPASVAAPTASLHFSDALLAGLLREGVTQSEVTLHVGAGTFAPIGAENFSTKRLFTEYYEVSEQGAKEINDAKAEGVPVIPVGTTAMRTIESAATPVQGPPLYKVEAGGGGTDIFIYPPYNFRIADGLITNFHVPRSSLMLLVDALLEHKKAKRRILDLYTIAINEKFRFYSFGDGMLIL
jgi:S-adenosylmethionine:tRNA ribosyltransferase-isomerase